MMNHRTTKVMLLVLGLALPPFATGCASRSTTEADAANAALGSPRQPEAEASAPDATRAAERARTQSETELATRKARATNMLAQLRASRDQVETMLDNAPMGKGSAADIAALRDDLGAVDVALTDIEQAMSAERFLDAIQKAQAAMESTDEIRAEIERATETQRTATSRRG